ncbi:MAG: hypothetical protein IT365_08085 [Candidatus Hydrogenedentes bacterium]|nr:hypothetical protein [Candidatus Hydrogenedentota bacterium]
MIWAQVRALVLLKVTLLKNVWFKGQRLSFLIATLFALLILGIAFGLAAGLYSLGYYLPEAVEDAKPGALSLLLLVICDGLVAFFLMVWLAALMAEIQRSEVIDFRKMLFLPVPLKVVFFLNFTVSLVSPAMVLFFVPIVGLALGLSLRIGWQMMLVVPLGCAFYFMLAGWTYYVRGILMFLLENKRRRRTVLVLCTMFFVMLGQMPTFINLTFFSHARNSHHRSEPDQPQETTSASKSDPVERWGSLVTMGSMAIPFGWFPLGVSRLAAQQVAAPVLAFAGLSGLGGLGLLAGYRSTLRHYTGRTRARHRSTEITSGTRRSLMEWRLPLARNETATLTLASFLGYVRSPLIRVQLVLPTVIGLIMIAYFIMGNLGEHIGGPWRAMMPLGIALWPVLSLGQYIGNVFGIDPNGFRAFVLLPTERSRILIGKNLGLLPVVACSGAIFIVVSAILLRLSPITAAHTMGQVVQIYVLYCILGNLSSIYFPYRFRYGGRQSFHSGGVSRLLAGCLFFPIVILGLLLGLVPTGAVLAVQFQLKDAPVVAAAAGVLTACVLYGLTGLLYIFSVKAEGRLLLQREQQMLETLTRDRE